MLPVVHKLLHGASLIFEGNIRASATFQTCFRRSDFQIFHWRCELIGMRCRNAGWNKSGFLSIQVRYPVFQPPPAIRVVGKAYHQKTKNATYTFMIQTSTKNLCCSLRPIRMYRMKPSHVAGTFFHCMDSNPHLAIATFWRKQADAQSIQKFVHFHDRLVCVPGCWHVASTCDKIFVSQFEMSVNKYVGKKHGTKYFALILNTYEKQQSPLFGVDRHHWGTYLCPHKVPKFLQYGHTKFRQKQQIKFKDLQFWYTVPVVSHFGCPRSLHQWSVTQLFCNPAVAHCDILFQINFESVEVTHRHLE